MSGAAGIDVSRGWEWHHGRPPRAWLAGRGRAGADVVHLPHCWNRDDTFQEGVEYRRGYGGYRRRVEIPGGGVRYWIETEGFYGLGELWIDGARVERFDGEYLGIRVDVTSWVRPGESHWIAFFLTNRCPLYVLPGIRMPDFLLHGGLAGRCRLHWTDAVSFVPDGTAVRVQGLSDREASLSIACELDGDVRGEIEAEILDPEGGTVASARGAGVESVELRASLPRPRRWDVDDPALYRARMTLWLGSREVDRKEIPFGVREASFRGDQGFFLNGRRVMLHGCNRHESIPGPGNALTADLHRADAKALKAFGCNLVRLSHYPQHPAFLDACDELGILVYAEIATWKSVRGGRWLRNALRQMRRMIRRDRNHPSVILWGLGNESRKRKPYLALTALVRELDDQRQTIYAENHIYRGRREHTLDVPDVFGVNYEIGRLDEARDVSRTGAVLISECASWPTPRGEWTTQLDQLRHIQKTWDAMAGRAFVAGYALWCFADYATLRKKRYVRYSGIVDAWRLPKMAAWLVKAASESMPFVKLFAEWGREGAGDREAVVISNCAAVRLVTGEDIHEVAMSRKWEILTIPYRDAPLRAEATSDEGVADTVCPWGAARSLALEVGPGEMAPVTIRAVDEDGIIDEAFAGEVAFSADGADEIYFPCPNGSVTLARGIGRIYVRKPGHGRIRYTATAVGVAPADTVEDIP